MPSADALKPGALVVVAGSFGKVIREARRGRAKGYDVDFEGVVRFAQDPYRAELGVTVCRKRRGECFCGLVHIRHPEQLRPVQPVPTRDLL